MNNEYNASELLHDIDNNIYDHIDYSITDIDAGENFNEFQKNAAEVFRYNDYLPFESQIRFLNRRESDYYMREIVCDVIPNYSHESHVCDAHNFYALDYIEENKNDIKTIIISQRALKKDKSITPRELNKIKWDEISDSWNEAENDFFTQLAIIRLREQG